jgi:catechol 2,3-dioxygenase-like lactoylglutathione lyase family enzyme
MHGKLHHIEIYVSDLEKSTNFWQWLLTEMFEYEVFQKWEQGISFKFYETYIVLVQTEENYLEPTYHRKRTGLNHLAFHCDSRQFVDDLLKKLIERNINILYPDEHPDTNEDYYAVYFEDPDRIKVEVVADK